MNTLKTLAVPDLEATATDPDLLRLDAKDTVPPGVQAVAAHKPGMVAFLR